MNKKQVRAAFRTATFNRDKFRCRCCNQLGKDRQGGDLWKKFHKDAKEEQLVDLDAHHITSRDEMPNGGYVASNGISVCDDCHLKVELYWSTGKAAAGFTPDDLYIIIGSSKTKALADSEKLSS
jgi:hypothetical protein